MNWPSWLFSAFLATLALSTMLSLSQGLGLTRMNLPYLIGTLFTADREKAKVYGFFIHLVNGWAFSLFYVLIFQARHSVSWWFGALIGLFHALFVLTVGMFGGQLLVPVFLQSYRGLGAAETGLITMFQALAMLPADNWNRQHSWLSITDTVHRCRCSWRMRRLELFWDRCTSLGRNSIARVNALRENSRTADSSLVPSTSLRAGSRRASTVADGSE